MAESVWDYPRPPRLEASSRRVQVVLADIVIADSSRALRVLETSHPPVYYIPREDIAAGVLTPSGGPQSFCEFKGLASYLDVTAGELRAERAAWTYEQPTAQYAPLAGAVAFYPSRMDTCTIDGVAVSAQEGDFYGGWITPEIEGPFKGAKLRSRPSLVFSFQYSVDWPISWASREQPF